MNAIKMPMNQQPVPVTRRKYYNLQSGVTYYTHILSDGSEVPEKKDMMDAALEQHKFWEQQHGQDEYMQKNAENIGEYARGVGMMKQAQDNPEIANFPAVSKGIELANQNPNFDYLTAPKEDIPKMAEAQTVNEMYGKGLPQSGIEDISKGKELLDKYKNKIGYAADMGLLDVKNPYSQKIFDAAVDELNPNPSKSSGLALIRSRADTPESRRETLDYIDSQIKSGVLDDIKAQSLINMVHSGMTYDANLLMGRTQMAGVRSYESTTGSIKAKTDSASKNPLAGMTAQDIQKGWERLGAAVSTMNAPKARVLGTAAMANMRADRALAMLKPDMTADEKNLVVTDIMGIMKGSSPDEEQLKQGLYGSYYQDAVNFFSKVAADPKALDNENVRQRLITIVLDLKDVDNKAIRNNLGQQAIVFEPFIQSDPERFAQLSGAVMETTVVPPEIKARAGITPKGGIDLDSAKKVMEKEAAEKGGKESTKISSKQEYDALPSGTEYIYKGKKARKP